MSLSGTTWHTPDKERIDIGFGKGKIGGRPSIHRWDKGQSLMLNDANKSYFIRPLKKRGEQSVLIKHKFSERIKVGTETIDGEENHKIPCKFGQSERPQACRSNLDQQGSYFAAHRWQSNSSGKTSSFKYQLKIVARGPQPAALFEIPKGYRFAKPNFHGMGAKPRSPGGHQHN